LVLEKNELNKELEQLRERERERERAKPFGLPKDGERAKVDPPPMPSRKQKRREEK
jgi:hypothetical protein